MFVTLSIVLVSAGLVGRAWAQEGPDDSDDRPAAAAEPTEGSGHAPGETDGGRAAVPAGGEGSGAAVESSSVPDPVSPPTDRDAALDGRARAEQVRERARRLTPTPRDPRVDVLRRALADQETSDVLSVNLGDLSLAGPLTERRAAAVASRARLSERTPTVAAERNAMVLRANTLYAELAALAADADAMARALLAGQAAAARHAARELASQAEGIERELAFSDALIRYLDGRLELVAVAVAEQPGVSAEVETLTNEIEAERERLGRETEITEAVAARAREAEERARAEREAARDTEAREIAERWESLAPRLQLVVASRTAEQEEIAALNARREHFATAQVEHTAVLTSVLSDQDREQRGERADQLFDILFAERRTVREVAHNRQHAMRQLHREVVTAREAVENQRREFQLAAAASSGLDPEIEALRRDVEQEELTVLEEELGLAELRYDNASGRWRLNEAQIHFYARTNDRLVPHLSGARRANLFRPNRENLDEVRLNVVERLLGIRILWRNRIVDWREHVAGIATFAGFVAFAMPFAVILLLILGLRWLPRLRDPVILSIVGQRSRPRLRRHTPKLLKIGEVIHETTDELLVLVALWLASRLLPPYPEVLFILSIAFWWASYRAMMEIARVAVLPRRDRAVVLIGKSPGEVRLGVDLWDIESSTARLVIGSLRWILIYLVASQIGLAAVRFLLGPGFFFYWAGWLVNVALVALVYIIAWSWRGLIVGRFIAMTSDRTRRAGEWLDERKDRFWSVLVVLALAAFLLATAIARLAARWAGGRGVGAAVATFAVRKKLERAAGETATEASVQKSALPVAYQRIFRDAPITAEDYLVARDPEREAVVAAFDDWTAEEGHGTIAVLGDSGSGKTTFLNEVAAALDDGTEVVRSAVEGKLTTVADMHAWLESLFGVDAGGDRAALVSGICEAERRVVIVDECANLYLRAVGGFAGVDEFLDIVALTNHRVFWVLCFDRYPWNYLHRVRDRRGYFRAIVPLRPFTEEQLRALIAARNEVVGIHPKFDRLVRGDGERADQYFEVVKTADGYFRLLAEHSRGNLRVALYFWLRSLTKDDDGTVHVTLFARPDPRGVRELEDEFLFALTAIVQHRTLAPEELARAIDVDAGECAVMANLLEETGYVTTTSDGRLRIAERMFFPVLGRLRDENFLHLE